MAELESANASEKEKADELARLDEERRKEGLQVEVRIKCILIEESKRQKQQQNENGNSIRETPPNLIYLLKYTCNIPITEDHGK